MLVELVRSIPIHSSNNIAKRIDERDHFSQRAGLFYHHALVYVVGGWQEPANKKRQKLQINAISWLCSLAFRLWAIEWVMILLEHPQFHIHTHTGRFFYILRLLLSRSCVDITEHASLYCDCQFAQTMRCNVLILYLSYTISPKQRIQRTTLQLSASCSFHGHPVLKLNAICIYASHPIHQQFSVVGLKWAQIARSDGEGVGGGGVLGEIGKQSRREKNSYNVHRIYNSLTSERIV